VDVPDTRDPKRRSVPLISDRGQGQELREFLEQALGIPKHARSFTVRFAREQAVIVTVEYIPQATSESDPCSN
jgi:hypothetical protein